MMSSYIMLSIKIYLLIIIINMKNTIDSKLFLQFKMVKQFHCTNQSRWITFTYFFIKISFIISNILIHIT